MSCLTQMPSTAYANQLGPSRMGKALDRALGKIQSDEPRHASVLRAELRRFGAIDVDKGGSGTEAYILHADELYEVATAFPTGVNINDVYDWIGLWTRWDVWWPRTAR